MSIHVSHIRPVGVTQHQPALAHDIVCRNRPDAIPVLAVAVHKAAVRQHSSSARLFHLRQEVIVGGGIIRHSYDEFSECALLRPVRVVKVSAIVEHGIGAEAQLRFLVAGGFFCTVGQTRMGLNRKLSPREV